MRMNLDMEVVFLFMMLMVSSWKVMMNIILKI